VLARWAANAPLAMIDQYVTNLKKLGAIAIDVGDKDGLAASNRQLSEVLTQYGIRSTFEVYEGDHTNRIAARVETKVLPFFPNHLEFAAKR
jgi:enterochelin esterase-like enzyme